MHRSSRLTGIMRAFLPMVLFIQTGSGALAASGTEIQQWLDAHNEYRAIHGVPPVHWSDTVAASAQAWADTCPSSHSSSGYGENLAFASYLMDIPSVVTLWYDEESSYDYDNPGFSPSTGHFTQVVWKSTTEIGCAVRSGCPGSWPNIWVCQYNPPGNYLGQFAENVYPPVEYVPCPQCPGDSISISGTTYPAGTGCYCDATTSISLGPDVTVESEATVLFDAPSVSLQPGTGFALGSYVQVR